MCCVLIVERSANVSRSLAPAEAGQPTSEQLLPRSQNAGHIPGATGNEDTAAAVPPWGENVGTKMPDRGCSQFPAGNAGGPRAYGHTGRLSCPSRDPPTLWDPATPNNRYARSSAEPMSTVR